MESEALRSVGYDEENQILEVEIRNSGKVYHYYNVPLNEYLALIEADSIGGYYNRIFKPKFPEYTER